MNDYGFTPKEWAAAKREAKDLVITSYSIHYTKLYEAGAGNLGGGGEVKLAELFADVGVILDWEVEDARRTPALDLDVGALVGADRHRFVGNIGQRVV